MTGTRTSGEPRLASVASWAVLAASFGLSATTWIALARLAGFNSSLAIPALGVSLAMAWLMPIAVDGYVVVALVLWMAPVPAKVAAFAKRNTYGAAGIGIAAQSAYHLLFTMSTTDETWRVVLAAIVGALPPAVAGLAVHMRALLRRESGLAASTETSTTTTSITVPVPETVLPATTTASTMGTASTPAPLPVADPAPPIPTPAAVAARISTKPVPSPRPTPVPVPATDERAARTRPSQPTTTAPTPPAASTDHIVTAQAPGQLALPLVDPALLDRATQVARSYHADNGTRITPGRLAVRLQVSSEQANALLAAIDDQPTVPAPTVNGRQPKATA